MGRAWDGSEIVIPGSPVQSRNEGMNNFILFLGKFAQRSNLTKTELVTEPKVLFDYLDSTKYEVSDARLVNDETVEVHYSNTEEFAEQDNKTNIVIAAFTTAYARLKLYDLLDLLQERVLYYDTDSVIYVHEPGKPPLVILHCTNQVILRWEIIWVILPMNWTLEITLRRLSRADLRIMPTLQITGRQKPKYGASR